MGLNSAALALSLDERIKNDWVAGRGLRRPRHVGQWTIGSGRIERTQAIDVTGRTWQVRRQCPLPFDAILICIRMGQTSSVNAVSPLAYVAAASVPSTSDADLNAAAAVQIPFGGINNPTWRPPPPLGGAVGHGRTGQPCVPLRAPMAGAVCCWSSARPSIWRAGATMW